MDIDGYRWIFIMDILGYTWISMDFIDIRGYPWISMDTPISIH